MTVSGAVTVVKATRDAAGETFATASVAGIPVDLLNPVVILVQKELRP